MIQPGDILFSFGTGTISNIIKFLTSGDATHVGIIYDNNTIFETDGKWGKAKFRSLDNYKGKEFAIYRDTTLSDTDKGIVKLLCHEYEGKPYSYWDIFTKGALFWLPDNVRGKITTFLGNDDFMICNELVMNILYRATGAAVYKDFEGTNPADLYKRIMRASTRFQRVI